MSEDWEQDLALPADERLVVDLDGFEGPIDMLLTLAREQKVDLARISILQLADQYLAFVASARKVRLELAADYLVMAAWLAFLKSRLLLPLPPADEEPSGEEMAAALTFQLQRLGAMQGAGVRLMARPRLGQDVFARGDPEPIEVVTRSVFDVTFYDLLRAYGDIRRRSEGGAMLRIQATELYSMDEALRRLSEILGRIPEWRTLSSFLPPGLEDALVLRSALASHLAASLELVREGRLQLRQDGHFSPIYIRRRP